jgi:hypothetical protein
MAELADAADSKSAEGNLVGVRPPLPAPKISAIENTLNEECLSSREAFLVLRAIWYMLRRSDYRTES